MALTSAEPVSSGPTPASPIGDPAGSRLRPARPGARVLLGWLIAAWVLPLLTHVLGVDWLLLIVAVVGTAGLVRGVRGPVDRLVPALALLYCVVCVAGLLFSVWPWGLAPVPVAGFGFTVLVLAYAATGRRFERPGRPRFADAQVAAGTALAAGVALWPMVQRGPGERLALFMHVEDFVRHILMYDTIRTGGGYPFLHPEVARQVTGGDAFTDYPTGSHFVFALTENFLRSTTGGSPTHWVGDYVWMHAAAFVGMCLAGLWGMRRLMGTNANRLVALPVTTLGAAFLAFGPPVRVFDRGYPQELCALALMAVLVALACRPLARTGDQIVMIGALLAGISFSYYLFLPVALLISLGWLVVYRRRVLRRWRLATVVAVVSLASAAVIPLLNWRGAPPGQVLLQNGQVAPVPRSVLILVGVVVLAGLLSLLTRVRPIGLVAVAALACSAVLVVAVAYYQRHNDGSAYFDIKLQHQMMIIMVVLLGGVVPLVARLAPASRPRWRAAVVAVLMVVPFVAFVGDWPHSVSAGRAYATGATTERSVAGTYTYQAYAHYPSADGVTTVLLVDEPWTTYLTTLYLGLFQGSYPAQYDFDFTIRPWTGDHPLPEIEKTIAAHPGPVRVITDQPATLRALTAFAQTLPAGQLTVLDADVLNR